METQYQNTAPDYEQGYLDSFSGNDDRGEFRVSFNLSPAALAAGMEVIESEPVITQNQPPNPTYTAKNQVKKVFIPTLNAYDTLITELSGLGLIVDSPILDGTIQRCFTGTTKQSGKKNGWYVGWSKYINGKDYICCVMGDWAVSEKPLFTYKSWQDDNQLPQIDREAIAKHQAELQQKTAAEKAKKHAETAVKAQFEWQGLSCTGRSLYLEIKGVQAHGVGFGIDKQDGGYIAIPLRDFQGNIKSLQRIYCKKPSWLDDSKYFLGGGEKKGLFHLIGEVSPDLPICFAEGYSTAASIHEGTNYPTVVCFDAGNIYAVVEEWRKHYPLKDFIICADNDQWKKENTGINKATAAAKAFNCRMVYPDFSGLNTDSKPTDFNDFHKLAGLDAVKKVVQLAPPLLPSKPHYPHKKYLSAKEASKKIQTLSDNFFKKLGANVAIKASAGSGKTRAVINSLSKIKVKGQVHVFVPTHDLANEWQENLKQTAPDLKVLHLYGRGGTGNDNRLCQRYSQVQEVVDKKIPVYPTMCEQSPREGTSICPFYRECRYINQFNHGDDIVIMPHSYLSLNHSKLEEKPAAVVIDERFFTELISSNSYQINKINDLEALKDFRFSLLSAISKVKEKKIGLFSALRETTQLNTEELIQLLNEILEELGKIHNPRSTHGLKPTSSELFFKECLSKIKTVSTEVTIISVILKELEKFPDREFSSNFRISNDFYIINSLHTDNRFNYYLDNNIPILMIDADCNEVIINELLNSRKKESELEKLPFIFNEIAVKRQANVIQYSNSQFAKNRFFPKGDKTAPDLKMIDIAKRTIEKISNNKKTLVITYKDLEPFLKASLPENIAVLHFGAIRGIDAYKLYDTVIILGRNQPPPSDMENLAAALFSNDAKQIQFNNTYSKVSRRYRHENSELYADIYVHADDRVQVILEQSRECELLQAIDRLRFIHSTDASREIHILTDCVLDIDVDFIGDSTKILPKGRQALAEIMALNGGILPLSPSLLLSCYSDKFNNIQQVKDDLKRGKSAIYNLLLHNPPSMTYRLSGQTKGKNLTAVFDKNLNPMDVINRIQELHGEPIQVISFNEPEIKPIVEKIEQLEVKPTFERIEGIEFTLKDQRLELPKMPVVLPYRLITGESGTVIGYDGIEQCRANLYERYEERLAA